MILSLMWFSVCTGYVVSSENMGSSLEKNRWQPVILTDTDVTFIMTCMLRYSLNVINFVEGRLVGKTLLV